MVQKNIFYHKIFFITILCEEMSRAKWANSFTMNIANNFFEYFGQIRTKLFTQYNDDKIIRNNYGNPFEFDIAEFGNSYFISMKLQKP